MQKDIKTLTIMIGVLAGVAVLFFMLSMIMKNAVAKLLSVVFLLASVILGVITLIISNIHSRYPLLSCSRYP